MRVVERGFVSRWVCRLTSRVARMPQIPPVPEQLARRSAAEVLAATCSGPACWGGEGVHQ